MKTSLFSPIKKTAMFFTFCVIIATQSLTFAQTFEKETPYFDSIEIDDNLSVTISSGDKPKVLVSGDEASAAAYTPDVKNNILKINANEHTEALAIEIVVTDIKNISMRGASSLKGGNTIKAGDLKLTAHDAASIKLDLDVNNLHTLVEGAAGIKYSGKAVSHVIQIKGAASVAAYNLETDNTSVELSGAGSAQVNVKNELSGEISGLGSILYKEEPATVNVKTSGLGTVKKASSKSGQTSADSDTTRINLGQKEVHIVTKKDDDDKKKKKKEKFDGHWGGLEIGMNNYLNRYQKMDVPGGYDFLDLNTSKSIGVSLNFYEQNIKLYKDRLGLVSGMGITWNNYRFNTNTVLLPKNPLVVAIDDTTRTFTKNKLTVSYLTVPLILEVNSGKNNRFHFGVGVIGGVRLGAHTKQVYEVNGSKNKDKNYDDFNLHPFKADATVRIGFGVVNLFANYSLTPLFKSGMQPELYPFTVGLRLFGL